MTKSAPGYTAAAVPYVAAVFARFGFVDVAVDVPAVEAVALSAVEDND